MRNIRMISLSVLAASLLLTTVAHAQRAPAPSTAAEARTAMNAINAKQHELGLPLATTPPVPRDCSVGKSCPNGGTVSCSASGKFTYCSGKYDQEGGLVGVACLAYKNTNPDDGKVSVNESSCG